MPLPLLELQDVQQAMEASLSSQSIQSMIALGIYICLFTHVRMFNSILAASLMAALFSPQPPSVYQLRLCRYGRNNVKL